MKKMIATFIVFGVISLLSSCVFAESVEIIDVSLAYEVTARADNSFFSAIYSIAIDEEAQQLYVLHDYPLTLSTYYLRDGNPFGVHTFGKEIVAPASIIGCSSRVFVLSRRLLWELGNKGDLIPVNTAPDAAQARADIVTCYAPNGLLLIDQEQKKVGALAWNGTMLPIAAPVKDAKGVKTLNPFTKAVDVALTISGSIYILDSAESAVRVITPGGKSRGGFVLSNFDGMSSRANVVSIDTDSFGNTWAANGDLKTLDVYNSFGDIRYRVLQTNNEGFRFIDPTSIVIDSGDRIYILDNGTNTVKVFEHGQM